MFQRFKQLLRSKTAPVSLKFILCSFILILLVGGLILFIFTWFGAYILETQTMSQEAAVTQGTTANLDNVLKADLLVLENAYVSDTDLSPSMSSYFDVGMLVSKNGHVSSLNFNADKFRGLTNFSRTITSGTGNYFIDEQSKVIIVAYIDPINTSNYSIGAIDLTGSQIAKIVNQTYHVFILDQSGNVLYTNTKNVSTHFIPSLHLQYDYYEQLKIGNIRREVLTYSPFTTAPLGVTYLSDPLLESVIPYTQQFAVYLILLGLSLFLSLIVVFAILVDIPLTKLHNFFDDYDKGIIKEVHVKGHDGFNLLADHINDLIKKLHSDFQRINKADEIQNDFLTLSAHILRTPIASIKGYIDILTAENKDPLLTEQIKNIEEAVNKLSQLEENFLAISQENTDIINAPIEACDIRSILEQSYKTTETEAKKKTLTYILDTSQLQGAMIQVNRNNLVQAINNLVDNAVKFTPEGGSIKLYGRIQENDVIISVSDTGIGLTKEEIATIFKKFSRISDTMEYNTEGLGIGLYVVKTIVEIYGGKVWVDSIKGSGSIFNIQLPLAS